MLTVLGLDEPTEELYRLLVAYPHRDYGDLAVATRSTKPQVRRRLSALADAGLLRIDPHDADRWLPVRPDVGLESLLGTQQAELFAQQERLAGVRREITDLLEVYLAGDAAQRAVEVELIEGRVPIVQRIDQLLARTQHEVLSVQPTLPDTPEWVVEQQELDVTWQGRGIDYRSIVPTSMRGTAHYWPYAVGCLARGEQIRLLDEPPQRFIVLDGEMAIVAADLGSRGLSAYAISSPRIVACLRLCHQLLWDRAVIPPESLTSSDRRSQLLHLLARGVKDEAIARQLGLGLRTVRREVAELMLDLGVETRFQAGVAATRRGWL